MRLRTLSPLLLLLLVACQTVPITGRDQLSLIPDNEVNKMSFQSYDEFLKENKVIEGTADATMVIRVGKRVQGAVEQFFAEKNMSKELKGYKWEFRLVDDKTVNAWCMPGGKVVVYSGILPITRDETGLAVVMGHEIAHAIAKHGNERMSQGLLVELGGVALTVALAEKPKETQALWYSAFGLGAQVGVMLPFSRLHENEADHLGLVFMSMAGYDPQKAVEFWTRMANESGGGKPPEFLSTHPSDKTRIHNIEKLLPEAMKYYRPQP